MRPSSNALALLFLAWSVAGANAYIQNERSPGVPMRRADFLAIPYLLDSQTEAGLRNGQGQFIITPGSDPVAAARAALEAWSAIPASLVRFSELDIVSGVTPRFDQRNLITFADTPSTRALVGEAVAITFLISNSRGELTDTDIVFNPDLAFSSDLEPGTFDIQGTLTHELGHALGMDHSGIAGTTMFAITTRGNTNLARLTADDAAFAVDQYPEAVGRESFGDLVGRVSRAPGIGVLGGLIVAVEPETNTMLGGISGPDGNYRIGRLPPGNYLVYAEPLDGPAKEEQLGPTRQAPLLAFRTGFYGGRALPQRVTVRGGGVAQADIVVDSGEPRLNVEGGGTAPLGDPVLNGIGGIVRPGNAYLMEVFGRGLDDPQITEDSLSFLGSGIRIKPGTLQSRLARRNGVTTPLLQFEIEAPADIAAGLSTLAIYTESATVTFSGGVRIMTAPTPPVFSSAGVVNAASFLAGPLTPGQIFSVFGENLGPEIPAMGRFDPSTGLLDSSVAGVSVTVDSVAAPLFYVSEGQINAQAPYEAAGSSTAVIEISRNGVSSGPIVTPAGRVDPALFQIPGTALAVVLNQDGSINHASRPAARGSIVSIFGTGQGEVDPGLATGEAAAAAPLSHFVHNVSVEIGGSPARISFAGMAPGFVGLFQINMFVPLGIASGSQVPVRITVDGVTSQAGTIIAVE